MPRSGGVGLSTISLRKGRGAAVPKISDWENRFRKEIEKIDESQRQKAGALLSVIPDREDWNKFLGLMKTFWRRAVDDFPCCLLVLYDGLAFYEYDANRFWPQFRKAVETNLTSAEQERVNTAFAGVARKYNLKIRQRSASTDYVGSGVYHVGIPLSLWDEFLEICEWALAHDTWAELSDEQWSEVATQRSGSRTRLRTFLLDNREAASDFIKEMHTARRKLIEDQHLTISDLQQASLLRQDYFDEVPETAEFLRPEDPESLIRDRARLVWDDDQARLYLQLPAVSNDKLPAKWKVGTLARGASSTPDTLTLNANAFTPQLSLSLESEQRQETQQIQGINPWGLFDLEWNRFVNPKRERFPLHSYAIISRKSLEGIQRKGFDEEDSPINDPYELEDGTPCYITRLFPVEKHAEITLTDEGGKKTLAFRPASKIEARMFIGEGSYAANFSRYKDCIKLERLPLLCLAIPMSSFQDTHATFQQKFQVSLAQRLSEGIWEKRHEDDSREFHFWRWGDSDQARKEVTISITSPELGIKFEYPIERLLAKDNMGECWQNLPGAFLPWILLAQPAAGTSEGMKWSDLMLAKEAIAPEQRGFSESLLRKYAHYGLLEKRGVKWAITESRAVFELPIDGECNMQFCGNPAVLWMLFRYMSDKTSSLPIIEVINKRGELPFLSMRWKQEQQAIIEKYLKNHNVCFVSDLWS